MKPSTCLTATELAFAAGGVARVAGLNLSVRGGEVLGLLGPNGAGKSTALNLLAGITTASAGQVCLNGLDLQQMPAPQRACKLAFLPQQSAVHWPLTVERLVWLGRLPHRRAADNSAARDRQAVEHALALTGMTALRERSFDTLSGGERMRAVVARMLAVQAPVLLADEPVSGLDPHYQLEFMELFAARARAGAAVVLVLHDLTLASRYCDRVLLMHCGRKVAAGPPAEVLVAERLREVYRIEALHGSHQGCEFVLPWSTP